MHAGNLFAAARAPAIFYSILTYAEFNCLLICLPCRLLQCCEVKAQKINLNSMAWNI